MSNPIFNMFNYSIPNNNNNNLGNFSNFMNDFNKFRQSLGSNPAQYAENVVKQMVSSGKISQEQLNQATQMASMIQQNMNLY